MLTQTKQLQTGKYRESIYGEKKRGTLQNIWNASNRTANTTDIVAPLYVSFLWTANKRYIELFKVPLHVLKENLRMHCLFGWRVCMCVCSREEEHVCVISSARTCNRINIHYIVLTWRIRTSLNIIQLRKKKLMWHLTVYDPFEKVFNHRQPRASTHSSVPVVVFFLSLYVYLFHSVYYCPFAVSQSMCDGAERKWTVCISLCDHALHISSDFLLTFSPLF